MINPFMKLLFAFLFCLMAFCLPAQLLVNTTSTIEQNVQNVLLGEEVPMSNLLVNGSSNISSLPTVGTFQCANCAVGIETGLLLSTGNVIEASGPNNTFSASSNYSNSFQSEPDMDMIGDQLFMSDLYDITTIEFDFVAVNESLDLQLVWASEEYEISIDSYKDFCAVLLSGPGISGTFSNNAINIASIPATDQPISVGTINNGNSNAGPCTNCEYYNQYQNYNYQFEFPDDDHFTNIYYTRFNGWTDPLDINYTLICGETYHIKIGIADATDGNQDSGLFIRSRINTSQIVTTVSAPTANMANYTGTFYEICGDNTIAFERPSFSSITEPFVVNLSYSGTSVPGVDYAALPNQITFAPGETTSEVALQIYNDGETESSETLLINLQHAGTCANYDVQYTIEYQIQDAPYPLFLFSQLAEVCPGTENYLNPSFFGGSGNFSYSWDVGVESDTLYYTAENDTTFNLTITDLCTGYSTTNDYYVNVLTAEPIVLELVDQDNLLPLYCEESGFITVNVSGGVEPFNYYVTSPLQNYYTSFLDQYWVNNYVAGLNTITATDACGATATQSINIESTLDTITINLPDTLEYHCGQLLETNMGLMITGSNSTVFSYSWSLDNSYYYTSSDTLLYNPYDYNFLIAYVDADCAVITTDTTVLVMLPYDPQNVLPDYVALCEALNGCTDPTACNYSSEALFNDSTCYYTIEPSEIIGSVDVTNVGFFEYTYTGTVSGNIHWEVTNGVIMNGQGTDNVLIIWSSVGPGTLTVYESQNGCTSEPITLEVLVTAINEKSAIDIVLYPVPTPETLNVTLPATWINSSYTITDATGRLMEKGIFTTTKTSINITSMINGQYYLTIFSKNGETEHRKFSVVK